MFEFLDEMVKYCEIVIFTAATKEYADFILDSIEVNNHYFDYRLYRQHTSFHGIYLVKDLSWLGRDLRKVIIVDNIAENFKLQNQNGLNIKTWTGEVNDKELLYLKEILSNIFKNKSENILPFIKTVKEHFVRNSNSYCNYST